MFDQTLSEAITALQSKEYQTAIDRAADLLHLAPENGIGFCILGIVAQMQGDVVRGIELLERAAQTNPDCRNYADYLSMLYTRSGQMTDSLYWAKIAMTLDEDPRLTELTQNARNNFHTFFHNPELPNLVAQAEHYYTAQNYDLASHSCLQALKLDPNNIGAGRLYTMIALEQHRFEDAIQNLIRLRQLSDAKLNDLVRLGYAYTESGQAALGVACISEAARALTDRTGIMSELLRAAYHVRPEPTRLIETVHSDLRKVARQNFDKAKLNTKVIPDADGVLRIGYISRDFRDTPFSRFLLPVMQHHDRSKFAVHCYQPLKHNDAVTTLIQSKAQNWTEIPDIDNETVAAILQGDEIDVLVDLTGLDENNRSEVAHFGAVPLQLAWLNYPHAEPLAGFDYVLSHESEQRSNTRPDSKLIIMPDAFAAYHGNDHEQCFPDVPAWVNNYPTLGAWADPKLITLDDAALWSKLLVAIPNSVLLFGASHPVEPAVQQRITTMLATFGSVQNVLFIELDADSQAPGSAASWVNDFAQNIDVFLPPRHFDAVEIAADLLWKSVPMLVYPGEEHAAHRIANMLRAANCADWVVASHENYIAKAQDMLGDLDELTKTRNELREKVKASSWCDGEGFTRRLESLYRDLIRRKFPIGATAAA